jgi:crotonobetainyl-CoA:carnitine CoA-transferase CaiB-like acyl-CoA transferase
VLMALYRRKETGKGDYLDMAMADSLVACIPNNLGTAMAGRRQPDLSEERSLGGNAMYNIYETRDGDFVVLGAAEMKFATNLLTALGRPDLIDLCKLPPGRGQDPVREFFRATFRTKSKAQWIEWFKGRDIAFAPVRTLPEMLEDPHFKARGMVLNDERGWDHVGVPIQFADEPGRANFRAPAHGEHSSEILRDLGYPRLEIERFRKDGVIRDATAFAIAAHRGS